MDFERRLVSRSSGSDFVNFDGRQCVQLDIVAQLRQDFGIRFESNQPLHQLLLPQSLLSYNAGVQAEVGADVDERQGFHLPCGFEHRIELKPLETLQQHFDADRVFPGDFEMRAEKLAVLDIAIRPPQTANAMPPLADRGGHFPMQWRPAAASHFSRHYRALIAPDFITSSRVEISRFLPCVSRRFRCRDSGAEYRQRSPALSSFRSTP